MHSETQDQGEPSPPLSGGSQDVGQTPAAIRPVPGDPQATAAAGGAPAPGQHQSFEERLQRMGDRLHQMGGHVPNPGEALANLASYIPGFAGYKSAEDRRIADKEMRAVIGERLTRIRARLDGVLEALTRTGRLNDLALVDQSGRRLERLIDRMRFADYGYAAIFDRVQMGDPELARIYEYDSGIMRNLGAFDGAVGQVEQSVAEPAQLNAALVHLDCLTADFDRAFDARKHLFDGLATP